MEYFILKPDGEQTGTFSIEQIRDMLKEGVIGSDTQYWHEGIPEWRPIDRIEESLNFQPPVPTTPPSTTAQQRKRPPASRAIPRSNAPSEKSHFPPHLQTIKTPDQPAVQPPVVPAAHPHQYLAPVVPEPPRSVAPAPTQAAQTQPAPIQPAPEVQPKSRGALGWILYVFNVLVVALAINYAAPFVHDVADFVQKNFLESKVTLTSADSYALVDRSMIKSFTDEMRSSPTADSLQQRIAKATDPGSIVRLQIGLEKEKAWHTNEVQGRYLGTGQAQLIDPGTYRLLGYFDDKGDPTTPRAGTPVWLEIVYKDRNVYALKAPDSGQAKPSLP